ncbi:ATP-binding cassette domain-containing protein [Streptomyces sp. MAR4 CNX-425]|uniref:ATP-binding cassette domain-containing protein n=1 Tax=Streptomyces sp. MAR4 CNX-425 TaxID=3406343 RepID=UPI003B512513
MIQAVGLTSRPRGGRPPAVRDLTFEAEAGTVTALLGEPGAGKTAALRLMLQLDGGRGVTLYDGRPLSRLPAPAREVGAVLGDVAGHPARTVLAHLRMLAAAVGVPAARADALLTHVGLDALADDRLDALSLSMDRRLGLATALLGQPHSLLLDDPVRDLPRREAAFYYALLRELAAAGVCVVLATAQPRVAARFADRVLTLRAGRLVADEDAEEFARLRLRPCVIIRTPQAERFASYLTRQASTPERRIEVVRRDGGALAVYGTDSAAVGELAYRNGILLHQLTSSSHESVLAGAPGAPAATATATLEPGTDTAPDAAGHAADHAPDHADTGPRADAAPEPADPRAAAPRPASDDAPLAGPLRRRWLPGPAHPLRYELRRTTSGSRLPRVAAAATLAASVAGAAVLARSAGGSAVADDPAVRMLTGWAPVLPLPPAAIGAGLLGAYAFGQEFSFPSLTPAVGAVPRRLGLLFAKLAVSTAVALLLFVAVLLADATALLVLFGDVVDMPADGGLQLLSWAGVTVGCAWTGVLAAGLFTSASLGLAAVLTVPVAVAPGVHALAGTGAVRRLGELPLQLMRVLHIPWPDGGPDLGGVFDASVQPFGHALALSLGALLGAYVLTAGRARSLGRALGRSGCPSFVRRVFNSPGD